MLFLNISFYLYIYKCSLNSPVFASVFFIWAVL